MARKRKEVETMELSEIEVGQLAYMVEQHDGGAFAWAAEDFAQSLVDKGFATVDISQATEAGDVPYSPTEKGIKFIKDNGMSEVSVQPEVTASETIAPAFEVLSGIEIPVAKRGSGAGGRKGPRGSKYPFATMENGQSFFVPATEEMPNPAKTLASTASTVAKQFATKTGVRTITRKGATKEVPAYAYTRKFEVRKFTHNGVDGAMVWRNDAVAE